MNNYVVSYAQNREDVILDAFFLNQEKGVYVDIGAYDPDVDSVTKHFYEKGWTGLNIEPNKDLYAKLAKSRPRDTTLNIAVAKTAGMRNLRIYEGAEGLSTMSADLQQSYAKDKKLNRRFKDVEVTTKPLRDVLAEQDLGQIDFMKVDVEGMEFEVLASNDWRAYRPRIICIEADKTDKSWEQILRKEHYDKVYDDGLNDYYVDSKGHGLTFDYANSAIARTVLPAVADRELRELDKVNKRLSDDLRRARMHLAEGEDRIEVLEQYIIQKARLKSLLKDLVIKIDTVIQMRLVRKLKDKKRYPSVSVPNNPSKRDILAAVHAADVAVFVAKPTLWHRAEKLIFKSVYLGYKAMRKTAKYVAKRLLRLIRKAKR